MKLLRHMLAVPTLLVGLSLIIRYDHGWEWQSLVGTVLFLLGLDMSIDLKIEKAKLGAGE